MIRLRLNMAVVRTGGSDASTPYTVLARRTLPRWASAKESV